MGKLLLLLASACLVTLLIGTAAAPNNAAFWLASSLPLYEHIREVLLVVLLVQLVTNPPRHSAFRLVCGIVALGTSYWALQTTYVGQMGLLDSFSLLAAAVAIGVTALEVKTSGRAAHLLNGPVLQ